MKRFTLKRQSGFTIIEVIVAISIIIILTSLTVSRFNVFSEQQDFQKEGQKLTSCIQKAQSFARDPSGNGLTETPRYVEARIERIGNTANGFSTRCFVYLFKPDTKYAEINQIDVNYKNNPNDYYSIGVITPPGTSNPYLLLYDSKKMNLSGAEANDGTGMCRITGLIVSGVKVADGFSAGNKNNCMKAWSPSYLGLYDKVQTNNDEFDMNTRLAQSTIVQLNMKSVDSPSVIRLVFGSLEGGAPIALKCTTGCENNITPVGAYQIPFGDGFTTYVFIDNADNMLNLSNSTFAEVKDYMKSITSQGVIKIPSYGYPITYENIND